MTTPTYINEVNAAHFLGLAPKTLRGWRGARKGPRYRKFHGAVRYSVADLETFAADGVTS